MEVKVLFFGMIAEKMGMESDIVDSSYFSEDVPHVDAFKKIYPALRDLSFQVAVDRQLNGSVLESTKEIALLPPFAGG